MNNLRKIRKEKKITQQKVAEFLGISKSSYSRYETEKSKLTSDLIIKLCLFFNVSSDYLLDIEYMHNENIKNYIDDGLSIEIDGTKMSKDDIINVYRIIKELKK